MLIGGSGLYTILCVVLNEFTFFFIEILFCNNEVTILCNDDSCRKHSNNSFVMTKSIVAIDHLLYLKLVPIIKVFLHFFITISYFVLLVYLIRLYITFQLFLVYFVLIFLSVITRYFVYWQL